MKKLLAPLLAVAAVGLVPAGASAACPPGTTNPSYCTADAVAAAKDNVKAADKAVEKATAKSVLASQGLSLKVDVAGPGTVTIEVSAKVKVKGKTKTVVIMSFTRTYKVGDEGVKIKLELTKKGKALLEALRADKKDLKVTVTSTFDPAGKAKPITKKTTETLDFK